MKSLGRQGLIAALCFLLISSVSPGPAGAAQNGVDYPHYSLTNTTCDACHYMVTDNPPPPWVDSESPYDALCDVCHNDLLRTTLGTHSSANTSDRYGDWTIECRTCHWPHHQKQLQTYKEGSYVFSGASTAVDAATLTMAGAGWEEDRFVNFILIPNTGERSYNYRITGNTGDTLTVEPEIVLSKVSAGNPFAIFYGKLIKSTLPTPGSGSKTVRLLDRTGANSFADGDATYDGVCEVCHTRTTHFRNDGSAPDQLHTNIGGGQAGKNCIACHSHVSGFGHGGGGGTGCEACHGHDSGFGDPDAGGKGTYATHSTHTENDGDDLRGPNIPCSTCHNTASFPDFADGAKTLAATTVCNNCHSPGGTYDGVNDAGFGAKSNWRTGIYDPDGSLKAGKDYWCIGCHDEAAATSGQDGSGVSAPNKAGDGATFGYYVTGHGVSGPYNATLHGQSGPGYLCTVCHNSQSAHISGAIGDALRLAAVPDDGLAYTSKATEACLDCHQPSQDTNGALGFDATAEATVHSGAVTNNYDTAAEAGGAFPAYGNAADLAASPGYQCEDCHEVHGTQKLAMVLETIDGRLGGASNPVAVTGLEATDTDLTDLDPSAAAGDGVCDACHAAGADPHPDTNHSGNHNQGNPGGSCMPCHPHTSSFAHGGGAAGGQSCGSLSCHGGTGSHAGHLSDAGLECADCHNLSDMPHFKDGGTTKDDTTVCADCHHDGTMAATGQKVIVTPPDWFSGLTLDCGGCHGNGPAYATGSPKSNSHPAHSGFSCDNCHHATTATGTTITGPASHLNNVFNLSAGSGVSFSYTFDANGGTCTSISCHGGTDAQWGGGSEAAGGACLGCHNVSLGNRAAIGPQFAANSHHVQGIAPENKHCYQCHWEAKSDGSIDPAYHGGYFNPGSAIDLVIYGAGERPATYSAQGTALAYTADGSRMELGKINSHCLSCHSDQNNGTEPFGDCRTPRQYAWDTNSIAARYSQAGTTTWGKYSSATYPEVAAKDLIKAYSAHGNAVSNQGGFDAVTGLDEGIANTRGGFQNVLCIDCHNAHGSFAAGITTSYVSASGEKNGGLLKNTAAGKGGYTLSYTPAASADGSDRNPYNAGADLCFDCHLSATATDTPWGYLQTFGATAPIMGYKDGLRFGTSYSGTKQRFSYRAGRVNQGGHLMASSTLKGLNGVHDGDEVMHQVNGTCTPCHDPHGVSPSLETNQQYGVPLLKGTWLTSPYREDSPEMTGTPSTDGCQSGCTEYDDTEDRHWNTDRVTFDTNGDIHDHGDRIAEEAEVFAGLCLRCHSKANLTDGVNKNTAWKSVDRLHETVSGWGNNQEHTFSCSKCHVPHNSGLPRLMQTNCLDFSHRMQALSGGVPSYAGNPDHGHGFFPGFAVRTVDPLSLGGCHEVGGAAGGGGPYTPGNTWPYSELWNEVTPW